MKKLCEGSEDTDVYFASTTGRTGDTHSQGSRA
jgi:hypothetical protein